MRIIHGEYKTKFYKKWTGMLGRSGRTKAYKNIRRVPKWGRYENFKKDMYKSYLEHLEKYGDKNTTIERIDNSKNYCKENCRWATRKEQAENRSITKRLIYKGAAKTIMEWANEKKISYGVFHDRLYKLGWDIEKTINTPKRRWALSDLEKKLGL